ncbi:MAG: TonB-dependent receptor [Sediminibacterium sp.]
MSKKLTLLSTLLIGSTVFAQKDTIKTRVLDEVIVTANKTEQKQSTTGKVITVIGKAQIEKSTGKTVAQVLNEQAGITINGALSNAGNVQTVFMRGGAAGSTLILIDGIPVSDPSQISNDFDLNFFSINDVERIEICKGAQSTLYGSDAVAGVINIITTKSDITKPVNIKATAVAGSFGTFKTSLQFFGKADKFSYTARYARLQTNGFSSAFDSTSTKNFDRDGYLGNVVNAAIKYQANNQWLLKAFTQYSQYTAAIDASGFTDKSNYEIHNKNHTSGAGFVYKTTNVSLTGNYQYTKQHRNYDDNASIGAPIFSMNDYDAMSQFAELYTSVKLGGGFTLLAGTDYRYGSMNSEYRSVSSFGPYNSKFPDTPMNQKSAYASVHFSNKSFSVELGGRWNDHSRYGTNYTYSFNPSYTFDEHYRIFGSIATAFKAPSLYQLFAPAGTGNVNLKPEESVNYEVGLQHTYQTFSDRLVFFYRNTNNGIDYSSLNTPNAPAVGYYNYVNQQARGIEYEVSFQPTEHLTLTGNYTFVSIQEITQSRVNFKDTSYNFALRRPAHNFNITAGYQFSKGLYASVSGKYIGDRYDVGGYKKADVRLDSYFIVGVYAEYKFADYLKIFGDVQNIGNKKFYEVRGYNGIPSIFNIGATFNW